MTNNYFTIKYIKINTFAKRINVNNFEEFDAFGSDNIHIFWLQQNFGSFKKTF